jgi:hypothetical protein
MDIIKRKLWLEDIISRQSNSSHGEITSDAFYIKIMLTQSGDDMGIFNNFEINTDTLFEPELHTPFIPITGDDMTIRYLADSLSDFETTSHKISGLTEDRLDEVRNYDENNTFQPNFDIKREQYDNYEGTTINGVDRVTDVTSEGYEYVIDTSSADVNIGTPQQNSGFFFKTFTGETRNVTLFPNINLDINRTEVYYNTEGWNETNVGHSGLTKEEYLFGISSEPQVFSDVFIDRGFLSPRENHIKLSEIKSLEDLVNYGNGFFNVKR